MHKYSSPGQNPRAFTDAENANFYYAKMLHLAGRDIEARHIYQKVLEIQSLQGENYNFRFEEVFANE